MTPRDTPVHETQRKAREQSHVEPSEPIAPAAVNRLVVMDGNACQQRRKIGGVRPPAGQHTPAAVTYRQHSLLGRAHHAEPALHASQDRHACVIPAILVEVPRGLAGGTLTTPFRGVRGLRRREAYHVFRKWPLSWVKIYLTDQAC